MTTPFRVTILIALILESFSFGAEVGLRWGTLEVSVDSGDAPFCVMGRKFKSGSKAASALRYIYAHWPNDKPPPLVLSNNSKLYYEGEDELYAAAKEIGKRKDVTVVYTGHNRSAIPDDWETAIRLMDQQEHAEKTAHTNMTGQNSGDKKGNGTEPSADGNRPQAPQSLDKR